MRRMKWGYQPKPPGELADAALRAAVAHIRHHYGYTLQITAVSEQGARLKVLPQAARHARLLIVGRTRTRGPQRLVAAQGNIYLTRRRRRELLGTPWRPDRVGDAGRLGRRVPRGQGDALPDGQAGGRGVGPRGCRSRFGRPGSSRRSASGRRSDRPPGHRRDGLPRRDRAASRDRKGTRSTPTRCRPGWRGRSPDLLIGPRYVAPAVRRPRVDHGTQPGAPSPASGTNGSTPTRNYLPWASPTLPHPDRHLNRPGDERLSATVGRRPRSDGSPRSTAGSRG